MKLKKGYITHQVDNMRITVNVTPEKNEQPKILHSNESAAFILDCLSEETTEEKIVEKMQAVYDAPEEVLARDVHRVIETLRSAGAIEE